tara:strand:+ start:189 stop:419 length:231 start_codon:yes stop_codon:yes gene_type:complete
MDLFSFDFTLNELVFIRQSLDVVSISGKDAKFLANLQSKTEQGISEVQALLAQEEVKKKRELQELIAAQEKNEESK